MGTSLHDATTAVAAAFTAAAVAGVTVNDGPLFSAPPTPLLLEVGWAGENVEAVQGFQSPSDGGGYGADESLTVWNLLSAWSSTVPLARKATTDALALLAAVIANDPTLGDVVARARVGEIRYTPRRREGGASASLAFTVVTRSLFV